MKAPTLHSFLEECRAAKTSDEIGLVVDQIEQKISTMRADRSKFDGQLQEAIVGGRDPGKVHTAIAQLDQDLMTLEAARAGFSQKQADALKLEDANAKADLIGKHRQQSDDLEVVAKEFAATIEKARVAGARLAGLAKQHERTVGELEALGERRLSRASGIIRSAIGEVRRADGVSEYGRRIDIGLEQVLSDNPSIMRRAQIMRRGRVGETNLARDLATEGWMKLARGG
jgi:hypothetical protein